MHPVSFALKRAQHSVLSTARHVAKLFDLTPARFDVLYLLRTRSGHSTTQAQLARALGVTTMTISRMVRRMEELGLLTRSTNRGDRRAKYLELTLEARRRIREAKRAIMCWGWFHLNFERSFGVSPDDAFLPIDDFYWTLRRVATDFGDNSTLRYPTNHPDD